MSYTVRTQFEILGDKDKWQRAADRLSNPSAFMRQVGNLGVDSSKNRLDASTSLHGGRSTGILKKSITIFDVMQREVVIGSNAPYAAQRNFGGTILPRDARALAIPLDEKIQLGPATVDPDRSILDFVPARGGASGNVFGLLVDTEGKFGNQGDALYALATHVDQEGAHFFGWDAADVRTIEEDIFPRYLTDQ